MNHISIKNQVLKYHMENSTIRKGSWNVAGITLPGTEYPIEMKAMRKITANTMRKNRLTQKFFSAVSQFGWKVTKVIFWGGINTSSRGTSAVIIVFQSF